MSHGSAVDVPGFKVSTIFPVTLTLTSSKKKRFFFLCAKTVGIRKQ